MNSFFLFIRKALSDGLTDTPSARRLSFFWFALLGGLALMFGLGFAVALLVGFEDTQRLAYYKETLDWVFWLFATGIGATGMTYGVSKFADAKGKGGKDETVSK